MVLCFFHLSLYFQSAFKRIFVYEFIFLFHSDPIFSFTSFDPLCLFILSSWSSIHSLMFFISLCFLFFRLQAHWAMWKLHSNSTWNAWMRSFLRGLTTFKLYVLCSWWSTMSSVSWLFFQTSTKPISTWQPLQTRQPSLSITGRWCLNTSPG